jgi:hypothetical protein
MPGLISGGTLRGGGSGEFIKLADAMPQLPPTPTTSTGYTLVTNDLLQTTYRSSLGNIEMHLGQMWSNLPDQNIVLIGTGTSTVIVAGGVANTSTNTGALIVDGGIGIRDGLHTGEDIFVNGLQIGIGWEGKNNIVVRGVAVDQPDDNATGQGSVAIGYDAMQGISSSYANIAIGRLALSTGTDLVNSIAIGDRALMLSGVYQYEFRSTITNVTLANPVIIESAFHNLNTGTLITIKDVEGTFELNDNEYYVRWLSTSTFSLYTDINVNDPLDGTGFTAYIGSGTVNVNTVDDNNIAIGSDAGMSLINGRENFLLGHKLARNLTTGSYNIFIGHSVANNMVKGNGNISIGGDNLVDGLNDQVNIGSLLYYNGGGYTQINSDTGVGLGTFATATYFLTAITNIEQTNPLRVHFTETYAISTGTYIMFKGVGGMTELNDETFYASYETATSVLVYYDFELTSPVDATAFNTYTSGGEVLALEPYGALAVLGGAGISGNLIVANDLEIYGGLRIRRAFTATVSTATFAQNLIGGDVGSIPYQTGTSTTVMLPIGPFNTILYSDGTAPQWIDSSLIQTTATDILINTVVPDFVYYPVLGEIIGDQSPLNGETSFTYVTSTTNTSSYFVTGTNILNIPGYVYAMSGNSSENNLLYTPRTFSQNTPPADARVGDFWINTDDGIEYQRFDDNGNKIWVQFAGIG